MDNVFSFSLSIIMESLSSNKYFEGWQDCYLLFIRKSQLFISIYSCNQDTRLMLFKMFTNSIITRYKASTILKKWWVVLNENNWMILYDLLMLLIIDFSNILIFHSIMCLLDIIIIWNSCLPFTIFQKGFKWIFFINIWVQSNC